jgi:hypothetical protein
MLSFIYGFFYTILFLIKRVCYKLVTKEKIIQLKINKKVAFDILNYEVDKLFDKSLSEGESVEGRIEQIEAYIQACGWSLEEFEARQYYGELN